LGDAIEDVGDTIKSADLEGFDHGGQNTQTRPLIEVLSKLYIQHLS
jgi:hypothetical protein